MAEDNAARKRANATEESGTSWKIYALQLAAKAAELIAAGTLTGFGFSFGTGLHRRLTLSKKAADVIQMRKTL